MTASRAAVAGGFATAALAVAGCGASTHATTPPTSSAKQPNPSAAPYSLARTKSCLRARHVRVRSVVPSDLKLRALRDGAQRTSFEARLGTRRVGVAIVPQIANASLLVELLQPAGPYHVVTRDNAVIIYRSSAKAAAAIVRGCLR